MLCHCQFFNPDWDLFLKDLLHLSEEFWVREPLDAGVFGLRGCLEAPSFYVSRKLPGEMGLCHMHEHC